MTNQEAIEQLKFDQEMILFEPNNGNTLSLEEVKLHNEDNYKTYLADDMAIKALEKQVPKNVGRWSDGHSCCPACKRGVVTEDRYCCYCGQRLARLHIR